MTEKDDAKIKGNRSGNSGGPTPFDDAFRIMEEKCDDLLIPLINYIFNKDYDSSAKITRLRNEHFTEKLDGKVIKKITDSHFRITQGKESSEYHMECESKRFGKRIMIRIFEYTSQIAVDGAEYKKGKLRVEFPNTGLLLLKGKPSDPDKAEIEIKTPTGRVSYKVPVIKESDFSLDKIFDKRLYFLIPFYIFNYEKDFKTIENDAAGLEELSSVIQDIYDRLDEAEEEGYLSPRSHEVIITLMKKIVEKLSHKYKNINEKMEETMSVRIPELDWLEKWDAEEVKANTRGDLRRFVSLICKKLTKGMDIKTIASELEEDNTDTIEEICEIAKKYEPGYDVKAICEEYIKEKGLFDTDTTPGTSKAAMA